MQERGLNLFQANSITSVIIGTIFMAEVPTGVIADRIGRKYSMVAAMFLQVVGEVLYLFARSYTAFIWIAIIAGLGFAFQSGALEALIYDTLPQEGRDEHMKRAMGLKGMAGQFAFALAPLFGGFLVPEFTLSRFLLAVFFTACSVGIGLLIALNLEEPQASALHPQQDSFAILRGGIGHVANSRTLMWLILIAMFTQIFHGSLTGLYQPYFAEFQIASLWMGVAFSVGALLAGMSERYAYLLESTFGRRYGFFVAAILPGLFYALFALSRTPQMAFVLFVSTYATTSLKNPLLSAYQNQLIDSSNRATVLSIISLISSLYVALVTLFIGWLADIRVNYAFGFIGLLIIVGSIVLRVDLIGAVVNEKQVPDQSRS